MQFAIKKLAAAIKPPLVREQVKGKEGGGREGGATFALAAVESLSPSPLHEAPPHVMTA